MIKAQLTAIDRACAHENGACSPQQGWQPIEAAPKDAKVWAFNGEQGVMEWSQGYADNGEGWALWIWSDETLSDIDPEPEQPTHWMPLPAAPTATIKDSSKVAAQSEGARDAAPNEGDQRLIELLTQAFGTRHPAIDDLASLILRANANARDASAQQDEREACTCAASHCFNECDQSCKEALGYVSAIGLRNFDKGYANELTVYAHQCSIEDPEPVYRAAQQVQADAAVGTVNIHHVKLKTRKEMEATIPRERWGWWIDVSAGQRMVLRDATAEDLARCVRLDGDARKPSDFLCELPANGALVSMDAIKHRSTIAVPTRSDPLLAECVAALRGVIAVADCKTDEFDYARFVFDKVQAAKVQAAKVQAAKEGKS